MADDEDPISLTHRRLARASPEQLATFHPTISFEDRASECKAESCKDFVFGYEAGLLDGRLATQPELWQGTYHTHNLDMLKRVAEARGYTCTSEPSGVPGWHFATFTPTPALPRLAVVPKE